MRRRARVALSVALSERPYSMLPAALPVALLAGGRGGGDSAVAQVLAALTLAPADLRAHLFDGGDRRQRRFVLDTGLAQGWHGTEELMCAERTPIRPTASGPRRRCAVRRCGPGDPRPDAGWLETRGGTVRALALTGSLRVGLDAAAAQHLDDRSSLVRATGREAARRVETDPLAHYRTACGGDDPAPGAVAGLAEVGSAVDAPLLTALLAHQGHRVRLAAVKGLRALDCVVVDELLPLLEDGSPKVVRAATAVLLPVAEQVPEALACICWAGRPARREAGYRLLAAGGTDTLLRAALVAATSPHATHPAADRRDRVVRRAVVDLTRLARDGHGRWGMPRRPAPTADAGRLDELLGLARRAEGRLGPDTTRMLMDWLGLLTR